MNTAKSLFCVPATLPGESQKEKPMKSPATMLSMILAMTSAA